MLSYLEELIVQYDPSRSVVPNLGSQVVNYKVIFVHAKLKYKQNNYMTINMVIRDSIIPFRNTFVSTFNIMTLLSYRL